MKGRCAMVRKIINIIKERMEYALRRLCGRIAPDRRTAVVLALLLLFAVASAYMTASSIRHSTRGIRIQMHLDRAERLQQKVEQLQHEMDSIRNIAP